jgi:hypothetical protein
MFGGASLLSNGIRNACPTWKAVRVRSIDLPIRQLKDPLMLAQGITVGIVNHHHYHHSLSLPL